MRLTIDPLLGEEPIGDALVDDDSGSHGWAMIYEAAPLQRAARDTRLGILPRMARFVQQLVEEPRACSYVAGLTASLEHRILFDVTPPELEAMLVRGWRRFGPDYFRPRCAACEGCVSTRVVVDAFRPTKSQRRAGRQCSSLSVEIGTPRVDQARLDLYRAWHGSREDARGWSPSDLDARAYFTQFAFPHPAAREVSIRDPEDGDRLVGIGLSDETRAAWSAIYFFSDPAYAARSLGVFNVLAQIAVARARGIPHVYLGFRISACPSMQYKARYHPQEVLVGRPDDDEEPRWVLSPRD